MILSNTASHRYRINQSFVFVLIISMLALAASYGLEVIEKIQPCKICTVQRACIFLLMLFAILGIFSSIKCAIGLLISIVSLISFAIACYHIGIQIGLFSDSCATIYPADLNDFKNMLFKSRPSCATIIWIFGLPISAWNLLISALICTSTMAAVCRTARSLSYRRSQYLH